MGPTIGRVQVQAPAGRVCDALPQGYFHRQLQRRHCTRGQGRSFFRGGEAPPDVDFDGYEVGNGMETDDMLTLGVVGLVLWLLLRSKAPVEEPPEEVVTSDIVYDF